MTLFIDTYEPQEIYLLMKPSTTVVVAPLNRDGYADYMWKDLVGDTRQWERKQLGEALSDLSAVEEQLNRELATCDELTLVVEGVGLPTSTGMQEYEFKAKQNMWTKGYHVKRVGLDNLYEAWKWGLRFAGVNVIETNSLSMTARALVGAYASSMKEEHTTLRRYLQPHIPPFDPNIHVDNLARLKNCGLGVERAKKLIEELGTFAAVMTAPRHKINSIVGAAVTKRMFETLGRE